MKDLANKQTDLEVTTKSNVLAKTTEAVNLTTNPAHELPQSNTPKIAAELLEDIKNIRDIQSQNGNWNYSPYMHGLYNGIDLIVCLIEGVEPEFRSAPDYWLSDVSPSEVLPPEVLARVQENRKLLQK